MNETKYTQGEWQRHGLAIYAAPNWKDGKDFGSQFIAQIQLDDDIDGGYAESEANAKLITVAPKLLEACKKLLALGSFSENGPEAETAAQFAYEIITKSTA